MRSTSSIAKEYLLTQPIGHSYTNEVLFGVLKALYPDEKALSLGGLGGFSSRAAAQGYLRQVRMGREYSYTTTDSLKDIIVRGSPMPGSQVGRLDGPHRPIIKRTVTREVLRDKLLELAALVEGMRLDLTDIPKDILLKELLRKERVEANGNGDPTT